MADGAGVGLRSSRDPNPTPPGSLAVQEKIYRLASAGVVTALGKGQGYYEPTVHDVVYVAPAEGLPDPMRMEHDVAVLVASLKPFRFTFYPYGRVLGAPACAVVSWG